MRIGAACFFLFLAPLTAQEALAPFDAPQIVFPSNVAITSIGDFNADGRPDGVGWFWSLQGSYSQATVRVFLNDPTASGGFSLAWNAPVSPSGGQQTSWDTETGELDGNPGTDLAYAFGPDVQVWAADNVAVPGQPPVTTMTPLGAWQESFDVHDLAILDMDHDGRSDLAMIGSEIKVYRNTPAGFVALGSFPLAGTELFAGDMDGDGFDELIVPTSGGVQMVRWRAGALESFVTLSHGVQSNEVPMHVVGDVDLDGDDDVVVFTEAGEYVTMRCIAPEQFLVESRVPGGPATGLADLDGDGDLDGVCCGGGGPGPAINNMPSTYHIAINLGDGRFAPAYTVEGIGAFRLAGAVDVDLDGDLDLVAGRTVWFNRGTFTIDPQPDVSGNLPVEPFMVSDVDHDGDPDVLANTGFVMRNDGAGKLSREPEQIPWGPFGAWYAREGYRGDFDGDGDEDRIVEQADRNGPIGMRLMLNTGGGDFVDGGLAVANGARFVQTTNNSYRRDLWHVTGDVDGDGDLDIVQGAPTGAAGVTVWWNDGTGHFSQGPFSWVAHAPRFLIDLDGDGFLDVVTTLRIGWGDGQGNFLGGPSFSGWAEPDFDLLDVGDVNADGLTDIAFFERSIGDRVLVYLNQGNRTFVERSVYNLYASSLSPRGIEIHDFDGDGHQDLMVWPGYWIDGRRSTAFLFGDSSGWFPRRSLQLLDVRAKPVDFDGDGDLDVVGAAVSRGVLARPYVDGYRLQYGVSTATAAGFAPTLGASGPFLAGTSIELSLTGAPGAAFVALGIGSAPATVPDYPLPGLVGHVAPIDVVVGFVASGTPGGEGTGSLRLPVAVPAILSGAAAFLQAWALDSATLTQLVQTNGLGLVFG